MSAEGVTIRSISDPGQKERIAREILEALPDWFENVEAREGYIRDSRERITFAAEINFSDMLSSDVTACSFSMPECNIKHPPKSENMHI